MKMVTVLSGKWAKTFHRAHQRWKNTVGLPSERSTEPAKFFSKHYISPLVIFHCMVSMDDFDVMFSHLWNRTFNGLKIWWFVSEFLISHRCFALQWPCTKKIIYLVALGQNIVAILSIRKVCLSHHPVGFSRMDIFIADLDELRVNAWTGRLRTVEREWDSTDLRKSAFEFRPLADAILETLHQLWS